MEIQILKQHFIKLFDNIKKVEGEEQGDGHLFNLEGGRIIS